MPLIALTGEPVRTVRRLGLPRAEEMPASQHEDDEGYD